MRKERGERKGEKSVREGERERERKGGGRMKRRKGVGWRVIETSSGKQRTNGNWFACRYTGKIEQRTHAVSQTKIDGIRERDVLHGRRGMRKEGGRRVQRPEWTDVSREEHDAERRCGVSNRC